MEPNRTPFRDGDIIRRQKFMELYNWWKSIQMTDKKAYYMAQNRTIKLYPYTPQEIHYNSLLTKPTNQWQ